MLLLVMEQWNLADAGCPREPAGDAPLDLFRRSVRMCTSVEDYVVALFSE